MSKSVLWNKCSLPGREITSEERDAILLSSEKGFALLREMLRDKVQALHKDRSSKATYDSPSWAYEQADMNGSERTLRQVLDILDGVCYNARSD